MDDVTIKHLYAPFELKKRKGLGGMTFDYISSDDVIDRMNKTFLGAWRTEVIHEERLDDSVLVRVRVHVHDSVTGKEFFHDGYGSAVIARYSNGPNKGNIIDLGNAYKSAESMAIRNACTRFGVGLFLKEGAEGFKVETQATTYKEYGVPGSPPKKIEQVKKEASIAEEVSEEPKKVPVPSTSLPKPPSGSSKVSGPKVPGPKVPKSFTNEKKEDTGFKLPKTPGTNNEEVVRSSAKVSMPPSPPKFTQPNESSAETVISSSDSHISDVQKAAIKGILSLKNIAFPELVNSTFEYNGLDKNSVPEDVDNLSYKEAIMVIKYGNEVFRQNR